MTSTDDPKEQGDDAGGDDLPAFHFLVECWKLSGTPQLAPSCLIVEEFTRQSKARNDDRRLPAFANWLVLFDEIVNWYSSLALALKREFLSRPPGTVSHHLGVMTSLASKTAADLCAIRALMVDGFEVQARILARSAVEAVELMLLLPHDSEMERAFFDANDFDKSNEFWHRYLSKGRLRKKANKIIDDVLELKTVSWQHIRQRHDDVYSILAHPSTTMGLLAMFPDEDGDDRPGHWGYRTNASIVTMKYLFTLCSNVIALNHFIPFNSNGSYPQLLEVDVEDVNHQALIGGWRVVTAAMSFVLENHETEILDPNGRRDADEE